MKQKCRGLFPSFSKSRKDEIEANCRKDSSFVLFDTKSLSVCHEHVSKFFQDKGLELPFEKFCDIFSSVEKTIERDESFFVKLGVTHEQVGDVMKLLMLIAKENPDISDSPSISSIMSMMSGQKRDVKQFATPYQKLIRSEPGWCT